MGVTHKNRKIHVHLQELLRKKFNTKSITVINAGNSATKIKDEIYIYNDLFLSSSKRGAYNVMIGNTENRYEIGTVEGSSLGNLDGSTTYESGRGWDTSVTANLVDIIPSTTNIYSQLRTFTEYSDKKNT